MEALTRQIGALIRLFLRTGELDHTDPSAAILVKNASAEVSTLFDIVRKRDADSARDIREMAISQARLPDLFKQNRINGRTKNIEALTKVLPTQIENEVLQYAALVRDDHRSLSIAAVGKRVDIAIEDCLVTCRVKTRDSQELVLIDEEDANQSVLPTLLADHSQVVLLGDPGGGKSTSVASAIHEYASEVADDGTGAVPFLIVLRKFARALRGNSELGFVGYLHSTLLADHDEVLSQETLRYLLHTGRAVVFFDGLDEILDLESRSHIVAKIEKFARGFPAAALVVTSRHVGYDRVPVDSKFEHFQLEPFDEVQVEQYATNIFAAVCSDDIDQSELLSRFMDESDAIVDLRENPLMLGILCYLFASGRSIPTSRLELYRRCADLLFDAWDEGRGLSIQFQDPAAAEQAVREVALHIFNTGEEEISEPEIKAAIARFYMSTSETMKQFRANAFADEVFAAWAGRKWILKFAGDDGGVDHYRFAHRTFLEFFAADQIAYESESAAEAWKAIRTYAQAGAATPLCQIVVQLMGDKTRGSSDKLLGHALDDLDLSRTGRQLAGDLNVLSLLSTIAASLKAVTGETRDRLLWADLTLLGRLTPWLTPAEAYDPPELAFLGYRSVFDDDEVMIEIEDLDELDSLEFEGDANIDGVSSILKPFVYFDEEERERLLNVAFSRLTSSLQDGSDPWEIARLAFTLLQVPEFESWRSMPQGWGSQLRAAAEDLWAAVCDAHLELTFTDPTSTDLWLAVALLRDQGIASLEAFTAIELRGLFIGHWPLPVLRFGRGTLAHTLILAALHLETDVFRSRWTVEEVNDICEVVAELISDTRERRFYDTREAQVFPPAYIVSTGSSPVSDTRFAVAAYLLASLDEHGDSKFADAVIRALPDRQLVDRLTKYVNEVREADGLDVLFGPLQ